MRLAALLVTAILSAAPAAAQPPQSSTPPAQASLVKDAPVKDAEPLDLPVSLDKIRAAIGQPVVPSLKGMDERPIFRVEIRERQKIDELLKTLKFDSGPTMPGGLYAYEQWRVAFPTNEYPMLQPYAAFSGQEMAYLTPQLIVGQYLAKKAISGITSALKAIDERAARDDVRHAIEEYCAEQPHSGAGIQICDHPPVR